ncbi:hypothetical protein H4582DRAFT_1820716, partial [Lactarius indigo]
DVRDHIIADSNPPSWVRVQNICHVSYISRPFSTPLPPYLRRAPIYPSPSSVNPEIPPPTRKEATALSGGILFITCSFSHARPTRTPGDATRIHSILNNVSCPSGEDKKRCIEGHVFAEHTQSKSTARLLLTTGKMIEDDLRICFKNQYWWIETCQVYMTIEGKVQSPICVIDFDPGRVYGQLVKPRHQITDCLTRQVFHRSVILILDLCSGITAAAPNTVTMTLPDVQTPALINSSTILLGRSLASDLHALQLAHPRCIGTAILFHYWRGRPLKPGLVWLTCKWPRPSM